MRRLNAIQAVRRMLRGALLLGIVGVGCGGKSSSPTADTTLPPPPAPLVLSADSDATRLHATVVRTYPHDTTAFTEGLLVQGERLFESTGLVGSSGVREVELESGRIVRNASLDRTYFGEGIAVVGDRLVQLTWRSGVAVIYDLATLSAVGEHRYDGEGWGLCTSPEGVVMSDGSATLTIRDPATFDVRRRVAVTLDGVAVGQLNELECVGEDVYANVWRSDQIVRIGRRDGRVNALIEAAGLPVVRPSDTNAVLNGIAYRAQTGTFLLTGKLWPSLFEVTFAPQTPR